MTAGPMVAAWLLASLSSPQASAQAIQDADPPPSWAAFRMTAEAGVRARLVDPDSAKIDWLGGFYLGQYKALLSPRLTGYIACGTVNSRNRMGGYNGASSFIVVLRYGRLIAADIDPRPGGVISEYCSKALRTGLLPPVPASVTERATREAETSAAAADLAASASGLTLLAMPDGAYVSAVAPTTPAALAGLKPGMVIAEVNGIPLARMGSAMLKVIDAAGAGAVLTVVGGKTLTLGGAR